MISARIDSGPILPSVALADIGKMNHAGKDYILAFPSMLQGAKCKEPGLTSHRKQGSSVYTAATEKYLLHAETTK